MSASSTAPSFPSLRHLGIGASILLTSTLARSAVADPVDVNPPLPNVLLLMDTSGSMERKSAPDDDFPRCRPNRSSRSEKSRWIEAMEVLTGSIQDYRCHAVDRSSTAFKAEYSLAGVEPADFQYVHRYHRPLSGTCTPGPGTLPSTSNPYEFPADAIRFHEYNSSSVACSTFNQSNDGILDSFSSNMRFGLMTFDTLTNPATDVEGTWSYFLGTARKGRPVACNTPYHQEVGARNAAAPPWEGRLVSFGDPSGDASLLQEKNDQIQKILLTTRPFGATPIAGMLDDARQFLWFDTRPDPLDSSVEFGPANDPYIAGACRKTVIVLLTDGEPNLDLRPFCEAAGPPGPPGECPFEKPEEITKELATSNTHPRIETFVVGFALANIDVGGSAIECKDLSDADLTQPGGLCDQHPDNEDLQVCCTLNRIAFNGGTGRAHFAQNQVELRQALSTVLSENAPVTSRTQPVFASANARGGFAAGYRFFTSFAPEQGGLWKGVLERQRFRCIEDPNTGENTPEAVPIDDDEGDDFVANVNSGRGPQRNFLTVAGELESGSIHSERTIRPHIGSATDGLGDYGGDVVQGTATTFVSNTAPQTMGLIANSGVCVGLSLEQCRDRYLQWQVGLTNDEGVSRCPSPGADCNLVADIYHSTPRVVDRPVEFLRDESYQQFASEHSTRPLMLYTSTNDGILHAFKVAPNDPTESPVNTKANNELWAFIPPAVLPLLPSQYNGHQRLLDGVPVVKDVIAFESGGDFTFERSTSIAKAGSGTWRTVLVQSFGNHATASVSGYFAIDVTEPEISGSEGPRFLWQLTTDDNGAPLFGNGAGTPLITTLFFNDGGDNREIAVAVLPGGPGGSPTGAACAREDADLSDVDPNFTPRPSVNCYLGDGIEGRSLTIVRLDNGEVIRTFRQRASEAPAGLSGRVIEAPLDSPITGRPVAFPGETGTVADRIFVGDADGTLWRIDVSPTNPDQWEMDLFFDAFPTELGHDFDDGAPIATMPVLSVDQLGNITVAIATGDQEVLSHTPGATNYVWSLTEKPNSSGSDFVSEANWFEPLLDGERVTGPMVLFNRGLFFSSFLPAAGTGAACSTGTSTLWGMDYLIPKERNQLNSGGKPRLVHNNNPVQSLDVSVLLGEPNATVFGVGIVQEPSCNEVDTTFNDPFFGYGSHTSITNIRPGKFKLVAHTGSTGDAPPGGQTNAVEVELETPTLPVVIDSWSPIIE